MTKARDLSQIPNASLAFRNRIINGAMMIDQRNNGASVALAGGNFPVDRMRLSTTGYAGAAIVQQNLNNITPPTGFQNYIGLSVTTGAVTGSTVAGRIVQRIEGFTVADLGFGSTGASTVTLSFWVRASIAGTYGGSIQNNDGNRIYVFGYTISAANTWEYKTVTITGDTTGTWLKTNGNGMTVLLSVGSGSTFQGVAGSWGSTYLDTVTGQVDLLATTGATFYITGVQLEKGTTATSFDYRPYGTELALCQRYYSTINFATTNLVVDNYVDATNTYADRILQFPVTMRAAPTGSLVATISYSNRAGSETVTPFAITNSQAAVAIRAASLGRVYAQVSSNNSVGNTYTFSAEL